MNNPKPPPVVSGFLCADTQSDTFDGHGSGSPWSRIYLPASFELGLRLGNVFPEKPTDFGSQLTMAKKKRSPKPGDPVTMPVGLFLVLSIGSMIGAFLLFRRGDAVAGISVLVLAMGVWTGFKMGLSGILVAAVALGAAIWLGPEIGMRYETEIGSRIGTTGLVNRFLCIGLVGVVISLITTLVLSLTVSRIRRRRRRQHLIGSYLGMSVGFIEAVAIVMLTLGGFVSMQLWQRDFDSSENALVPLIDEVASQVRQSSLGPYVLKYNPFEQIPALAAVGELQQAVRQINSPGGLQQVLRDPVIQRLRSDPEIADARDQIRNDPELSALTAGAEPPGGSQIMRLLRSHSVQKLVADPQFLARVRQVIAEAN